MLWLELCYVDQGNRETENMLQPLGNIKCNWWKKVIVGKTDGVFFNGKQVHNGITQIL